MRAHETARLVAEPRGLDVTAIRDLRERHFGTWEGLTDDEIYARFTRRARARPWGDGETREEMAERVLAALRRIADDAPGRAASSSSPTAARCGRC